MQAVTSPHKRSEEARLIEEITKRQEEVEKRHKEELKRAEELKEQLESLWDVGGHSNPPLPRVPCGLPFSEQTDSTLIPPQFKELVVDPFDSS
ncbi:hypothetical protein CR513_16811, partial [Mucuna pruriens]